MSYVTVSARVVGQKRPVVPEYRLLSPFDEDTHQLTLHTLITRIVTEQIEAFRQRQDESHLQQVLSPASIVRGASAGRIDPGEQELTQPVDDAAAVSAALQAFEDGLYFVFLDDIQVDLLSQPVRLNEDSRIMFVRLIALAGG